MRRKEVQPSFSPAIASLLLEAAKKGALHAPFGRVDGPRPVPTHYPTLHRGVRLEADDLYPFLFPKDSQRKAQLVKQRVKVQFSNENQGYRRSLGGGLS